MEKKTNLERIRELTKSLSGHPSGLKIRLDNEDKVVGIEFGD